ncbi:S1 RNA-binding domain-containing protein [Candidatus Woesebacteria bacterium]|nr:S1 RNA-binding domain-containing protein [Candidatus Woesebacteria bacterium]
MASVPAASKATATKKKVTTPKKVATEKIEKVKTPAKPAAKAVKKEITKKETATKEKVAPAKAVEPVAKKAEAPVEKPAKKVPGPSTMAALMDIVGSTVITPQKGKLVSGVIVAKNRRSLVLDIGSKTEGVVSDREYSFSQDYIETLNIGDEIEAQVVTVDAGQGQVLLSLRNAAMDARWTYFKSAMDEQTSLEAKAVDVNKGGLIVVVNGMRGFIPSSQFSRQYVTSYSTLRGKSLDVKVIEVDREKNRLIFSERHVTEAGEIAQRDKAMDSVKSGEIYDGVVSGVMPFGLFVTVQVPVEGSKTGEEVEVEGLVHISEISWEKVAHPKEYHAVNDTLKVKVLGTDERTGKLNLSIKQLSDDPWQTIEQRYETGMTIGGKVSRVESFGVFVNVEAGVDGLIHSSKLESGVELKKGESITVHVESVDSKQRRMSLSLVLTEVPMGYK